VEGWDTVEILHGDGPPKPAYLAQYDDSGNWRWAPHLSAWVGSAYNVSWNAAATISPGTPLVIDGLRLQLYVGDWTVEGTPAIADPAYAASQASAFGLMDNYGQYVGWPTVPKSAPGSGSGVAFVVQSQSQAADIAVGGSFEDPVLSPWGVGGTATAVRDDGTIIPAVPPRGFYQAAVSGTGGAFSFYSLAGPGGIPVVGGRRYRVNALMYVNSADTYTTAPGMTVSWYNSAGNSVGSTARVAHFYIDAYGSVQLNVTAPASASAMQITFDAVSTGAATFGVDAVVVYQQQVDADPTQPNLPAIDVLQLLGNSVTVGSTFTYPPEDVDGVGDDGDYYLDKPGKALYGPKDDGSWPPDPAVEGFNLTRLVR
jgi:hypothetical protein